MRQSLLIPAVDCRDPVLARPAGQPLGFLHGQHLVLRVADPVHDARRRQGALVHFLLPQALLHEAQPIVLVVDDEVGRDAQVADVRAEDPDAGRVKRGDERGTDARWQQEVFHPPQHLLGGLVGERDGEDVLRVDPLDPEQVRDPVGDDPRLSAPRPRQDQERPFGVGHGLPLGRVEVLKDQVGGQTSSLHGTLRYHSGTSAIGYLGWNCWGSLTHR